MATEVTQSELVDYMEAAAEEKKLAAMSERADRSPSHMGFIVFHIGLVENEIEWAMTIAAFKIIGNPGSTPWRF